MKVTQFLESLSDEEKHRLFQWLGGAGQEQVNIGTIRSCKWDGELWVSRTDLVAALTTLAEESVSDQKQEAYKGVRFILSRLGGNRE